MRRALCRTRGSGRGCWNRQGDERELRQIQRPCSLSGLRHECRRAPRSQNTLVLPDDGAIGVGLKHDLDPAGSRRHSMSGRAFKEAFVRGRSPRSSGIQTEFLAVLRRGAAIIRPVSGQAEKIILPLFRAVYGHESVDRTELDHRDAAAVGSARPRRCGGCHRANEQARRRVPGSQNCWSMVSTSAISSQGGRHDKR
jgi:hypothetical protein